MLNESNERLDHSIRKIRHEENEVHKLIARARFYADSLDHMNKLLMESVHSPAVFITEAQVRKALVDSVQLIDALCDKFGDSGFTEE